MQRSWPLIPALAAAAVLLVAGGAASGAAGHAAGQGVSTVDSGGPAVASADARAPIAPPVLLPVSLGSARDGVMPDAAGDPNPEPTPESDAVAGSADPTGSSGSPGPEASASSEAGPPADHSAATGAPLDADAVAAAIAPLLTGGALGPGRSAASVIDVATGEVLYRASDEPTVPASTMKLVTAVSVLDALGPDSRLRTRAVVLDPDAASPRVVIVGAGDPSLRSTPGRTGRAGTSLTPASLERLASSTARALALRGITRVRVRYDDSLFTGPALHPSWAASFPAAGIVAPVSSLVVDQGRRTPGGNARVPDPAARAGQVFADALADAGVNVRGEVKKASVSEDAATLAFVESPTLGVLVERMLATSDNDYAEILGRLAASASGESASFAGVAARAAEVLADLGVDDSGARFSDASGLSRGNRLAPSTLTSLLAVTAEGYGSLHSGLPVAGATGSLAARFQPTAQRPARGVVRAKTGTLTGVGALAGYVSRPDGRLLAFGFVDGSTPGGALAARAAFDRAAAALVSCDCAVR